MARGEVGVAGEWSPGSFFLRAAGARAFLAGGAGAGWAGAIGVGGSAESHPIAIMGANTNVITHAVLFISLSLASKKNLFADAGLAARLRAFRETPPARFKWGRN